MQHSTARTAHHTVATVTVAEGSGATARSSCRVSVAPIRWLAKSARLRPTKVRRQRRAPSAWTRCTAHHVPRSRCHARTRSIWTVSATPGTQRTSLGSAQCAGRSSHSTGALGRISRPPSRQLSSARHWNCTGPWQLDRNRTWPTLQATHTMTCAVPVAQVANCCCAKSRSARVLCISGVLVSAKCREALGTVLGA